MANALVSNMPTPIAWPTIRFDARHGQIAAQCVLLILVMVSVDFSPSPFQIASFVAGTLAMEALHARLTGSALNWKSALPTALSLSLLLRTHDPAIWVGACVIAMGSKYLLRVNGKHLFNPSAFAIVVLLAASSQVWMSPGQWGTRLWLAALVGAMGGMVLSRVARLDIALTFLIAHMSLLLLRAWSLGDPLTIPLHQIQSGAVLIFALFMLTDPRSTPDSRAGRLIFAAAVAAAAHLLLFRFQIREGLLYALVLVSCATPLIDRIFPAPRFVWSPSQGV